jgi:hypothetical protein
MNILLKIFIHLYGGPEVGEVESDVVEMERLSMLLRSQTRQGREDVVPQKLSVTKSRGVSKDANQFCLKTKKHQVK